MSERPFTPPSDDEFDAALRAGRPLLPRFDAHVDDEPPPEIDRLVLSRAREALRRESAPERHYRSPRWAAPLAIAATVLLSLGLVLQRGPSRNDAVRETGGDATAMTDAEPDAAVLAESPAPVQRAAPQRASADDQWTARRKEMAPAAAAPPAMASAKRATAEVATAEVAEAASAPPADATRGAIPRDDPRRWLTAIEQLQDAGELDAARRELVAFRLRHPDLPLPESLDALR